MGKFCCITLDNDNYCDILDFLSIKSNRNVATIYDNAIPRLLELFDRYNVKATFFVVGRDMLEAKNSKVFKDIINKGHEIANHTMNHCRNFSKLNYQKKISEITDMEKIAMELTGCRPVGFRAPAHKIDIETLTILKDLGYIYDSSILPSWFVVVMKIFASFSAGKNRKFSPSGEISFALAPTKPYIPSNQKIWKIGNLNILELPISVDPLFHLPFYSLFYLLAGKLYFRLSYSLKRLKNDPLFFIFHSYELTDFLKDGADEKIKKYPGMNMDFYKKYEIFKYMIFTISKEYEFVTAANFAKSFFRD